MYSINSAVKSHRIDTYHFGQNGSSGESYKSHTLWSRCVTHANIPRVTRGRELFNATRVRDEDSSKRRIQRAWLMRRYTYLGMDASQATRERKKESDSPALTPSWRGPHFRQEDIHPEDGGTLRRGDEGEDDGRPAVSVDKYVAFVFAAKETGNNKRTGSAGGKRREEWGRERGKKRERKEEPRRTCVLVFWLVYTSRIREPIPEREKNAEFTSMRLREEKQINLCTCISISLFDCASRYTYISHLAYFIG